MNILSMLARLEGTLGCSALTKQLILRPQSHLSPFSAHRDINLVVGYNDSPRSQSALDLTLWIAYQTRLATSKQVTVQVVYVVNLLDECHSMPEFNAQATLGSTSPPVGNYPSRSRRTEENPVALLQSIDRRKSFGGSTGVLDRQDCLPSTLQTCQIEKFEQADYVLWQARHLAEEWRGSLKTHLRFGQVAQELRSVIDAEEASLLVLGCESAEHPLVQQLGHCLPCPVLGIPVA